MHSDEEKLSRRRSRHHGLVSRLSGRVFGMRHPLILLVVLGMAVNAVWLLAHPPALTSGETAHWWPIVLNVAHGRGYAACFPEYFPNCTSPDRPTLSREPAPVLIFAAVARLSGDSLKAASWFEALIHLGVLVALFLLARHLIGPRAAVLAGLLWIAYLPSLKLIPQVSGDLLAALGIVAGLHFFLRALATGRIRFDLGAGLSLGLAALSRSACLLLIPLLVAVALIVEPGSLGKRLRSAGIFIAAGCLLILPWVVRNYEVFGRPQAGSTLTGYNLYRENYMLPSDHYLRFVAGEEGGRALTALLAKHWKDLKGTEDEMEMDAIYRKEALSIIRHWPLRYALLSAYRFLLLWFGWGYLEAYGAHPLIADYLVMAAQGIFLLLALGGIYVLRRKAWPLFVSVAGVCLLYMAVIAQLRFLVPVMPLVMVLSAASLAFLFSGLPGGFGPARAPIPER